MQSQRGRRLKLNTISSLAFQVTTLICGFVLPRLILGSFGSEVNGLVNSITQFLHIIAFLELGVGAVVQSSLYKPLADADDDGISKIITSANKFFVKIAIILLAYVVVLIFIYPAFVNSSFDHIYAATLILAMSISSFAQYYFGVVDRLLLTADQRGYIQYTAQSLTLLLNTAACAVLIKLGASIHVVKLSTSIIYLLRPFFLRLYVNRNYNLNRKIQYDEEPIKQKWNGIAQHIASVVLDQTDIIVLTVFSTLTNVSIYSVYHLVIFGVKNLFLSLTNGVQSLMGEMLARREMDNLRRFFDWTEWLLHTGTIFVFGCTGVLILPFVQVYTKGVTDANYIVPLFAILITIAHAGHCLRLPYNILILSAGHYKQTQGNYIIAACMNIVISILTVRAWGLVGVAIGTLVAMLYQTVWMAFYDSRNILESPISGFFKHLFVDAICVIIAGIITYRIPLKNVNYVYWFLLAVVDAVIWGSVIIGVNYIFYKDKVQRLVRKVLRTIKR